jgi:thiosulfate reductase cytochrome b subunit
MPPPKPSFTRAMTVALIITLPAALLGVLLVPGRQWAEWSRWIILAAWLGFGALAGQHTLQKMAGDAGPRWESNFGADRYRGAPKKDR